MSTLTPEMLREIADELVGTPNTEGTFMCSIAGDLFGWEVREQLVTLLGSAGLANFDGSLFGSVEFSSYNDNSNHLLHHEPSVEWHLTHRKYIQVLMNRVINIRPLPRYERMDVK